LHDSTNTARLKPQLNAADYYYNIAQQNSNWQHNSCDQNINNSGKPSPTYSIKFIHSQKDEIKQINSNYKTKQTIHRIARPEIN